MKKLSQLLSLAVITILLYSCASSNQSAFQKRKYYDFKHGDTEIALNKPVKHQNHNESKSVTDRCYQDVTL